MADPAPAKRPWAHIGVFVVLAVVSAAIHDHQAVRDWITVAFLAEIVYQLNRRT